MGFAELILGSLFAVIAGAVGIIVIGVAISGVIFMIAATKTIVEVLLIPKGLFEGEIKEKKI